MRSPFSAGDPALPPWAARLVARLGPRSAARTFWWLGIASQFAAAGVGAWSEQPLVPIAGVVPLWYLVELSLRVRCRCGLPLGGRYDLRLVLPQRCRGCGHDLTERPANTGAYR